MTYDVTYDVTCGDDVGPAALGSHPGRAAPPRGRWHIRPAGGGEEDTWARC